ncbi:transformer 2 beta, partial [Massospora cicadina]
HVVEADPVLTSVKEIITLAIVVREGTVIDNPPPSEVLGVFGLSSFTRESDLEKLFSEYGRVEQ